MGVGGMPASAQQFAAVTSSSSLPSSQSAASTSRTGQSQKGLTRQGSLRPSTSLQDFSLHRGGSLPNGFPRTGSLVGPFGSLLPGQHMPRSDGGPTLTTIKSNLLRRLPGSVIPPFGYTPRCARTNIILGLVALIGTTFFLSLLWEWSRTVQNRLEYAVVIDCGSTGTRVHVYGWTHDGISGKESLPVMVHPPAERPIGLQRNDGAPSFDKEKKQQEGRPYKRMETEPGLDKLLHNESGVASAISPLIDWAVKQIPRDAHKRTQLFFLATAGLRRLPPDDARWLLDKAWSSLVQSPFMCRREWVRVITGQEEAYYGWIALNYNLNRLGHTAQQPTLGALDLGGSSLEVTFEPSEIPEVDYLVNVSVGSADHHLYAHSHAGFGLNDAFEKSVAWLMEHNAPSVKQGGKGSYQVSHPCLNSGYKEPFVCSSHCVLPPVAYAHDPHKGRRHAMTAANAGPKVELIGKPNWARCQSLVESVINMSKVPQTPESKDCGQSPCALGKYQPEPQGQFFALAGFYVVYRFFGLSSRNSLDDLLQKGQQFCKLKWEDARQSVAAQPSIDRYCFRAPYMVGLLRQGLHLRDKQVTIGSGDFAWTLGAALNEAGALLPVAVRGRGGRIAFPRLRQAEVGVDLHTFTFLFVVVLLVLVLLTYSWQWISSHQWRRPYIPLFVSPTSSTGPCSWFPPTFCSQVRPGTSSGTATGQPGEGRLKQPQSPAPSDPKTSFHHQMFGLGTMHAGGDGPVLECDVLQTPSGAGTTGAMGRPQVQLATVMMQQKGGSRLQSRRSQSREDLSNYVSPDNAHIHVKITRELSPVRNFTPLRHDFTI